MSSSNPRGFQGLDEAPVVMGVLNVTPDSFSDGGRFLSPEAAVERASTMLAEGARIVDIGPESTRPGSAEVDAEEQLRRAIPVVHAVRERHPAALISIDTRLARVAREALLAGANIVNDTSALRDEPDMLGVVAEHGAGVVLMHRRGTPETMQRGGGPDYDDVIGEIREFLLERAATARSGGVPQERIFLDPGIGFGKRIEHNLRILQRLEDFAALGYPVVVGASRKQFIGSVLGLDQPEDRDAGSIACAVWAVGAGVAVIRTHCVGPTVQAVRLAKAIGRAAPHAD